MSLLSSFVIGPCIVLLLSLIPLRTGMLSRLASVALWCQCAISAFALYPVFTAPGTTLNVLPGLSIDRLGAQFVILTLIIVAACMTHAGFYFGRDGAGDAEHAGKVRRFYACTSLFTVAMTAVFFCDNLGYLWIAIEAATLCSAPLVYYHGTRQSLEAAWKYLIICSVGIAFALLGTILIFTSSQFGAIAGGSLSIDELTRHGPRLQYQLVQLGFLFCLLGYGTKAGIFPLHSWMPDTYSQSPAPASAMFSGGMLNCALFAIWRLSEMLHATSDVVFAQHATTTIGVVTVLAASLFLVHQHSLKRLLAYSSVENVGVMLVAIGLGAGHIFFLLALNHSAVKAALLLTAGNVVQNAGSETINKLRGLLARNPDWAALMTIGALALTGAPPFGAFGAEWLLLAQTAQAHLFEVMACLLIAFTISFLSVMFHVGKIISGSSAGDEQQTAGWKSNFIPASLIFASFFTGITSISWHL